MPRPSRYDVTLEEIGTFVEQNSRLTVLLPPLDTVLRYIETKRIDSNGAPSQIRASQGTLTKLIGGGMSRLAEISGYQPNSIDRIADLKDGGNYPSLIRKLVSQVGWHAVHSTLLDTAPEGHDPTLIAPETTNNQADFSKASTKELTLLLGRISTELIRRQASQPEE